MRQWLGNPAEIKRVNGKILDAPKRRDISATTVNTLLWNIQPLLAGGESD